MSSRAALSFLLLTAPLTSTAMTQEPRTITVSGEAEVKVTPDEVIITLGVETLDKELLTAKKENDERMKRILAAAKSVGLEDKRIATDHVSIEPRHEWINNHNTFIGYAVRRSIALTVRDLAKFDPLLAATLQAGANFVHGIQFNTTELRKHRDQARSLAMKAALEKATALAKELNQKVGRPRTIVETGGRYWSGYGMGWGNSRSGQMSQNVFQNAPGGSESIQGATAPGMVAVNASVQVVFELE